MFSDKERAEPEYRKWYDKIAVLASAHKGFGVTYLTELFIEALTQARKEGTEKDKYGEPFGKAMNDYHQAYIKEKHEVDALRKKIDELEDMESFYTAEIDNYKDRIEDYETKIKDLEAERDAKQWYPMQGETAVNKRIEYLETRVKILEEYSKDVWKTAHGQYKFDLMMETLKLRDEIATLKEKNGYSIMQWVREKFKTWT